MFKSVTKFSKYTKNYVTVSKTLDESIKKLLKPDVIKYIESRDDTLLIKKLNFMGPSLCVRLNVAAKLLVQQVNGESAFNVIGNQIEDPWEVYWFDIIKNESSVEKWVKSIKKCIELDIPLQTSQAFILMSQTGIDPLEEHYHLVMSHFAEFNGHRDLCWTIDELRRCLEKRKPTQESYLYLMKMVVHNKYPEANVWVERFMKKRGFDVPAEWKKIIDDALAQQTERKESIQWYGKGSNLEDWNKIPKAAKDFYWGKQTIINRLEASRALTFQPLNEWLVVKEFKEDQ